MNFTDLHEKFGITEKTQGGMLKKAAIPWDGWLVGLACSPSQAKRQLGLRKKLAGHLRAARQGSAR